MSEKPRILALFGSAVLFGAERGNIEALAALRAEGAEILCLVRDEAWSTRIPPALDARGLAWCKVPYIEHRTPGRMLHLIFRNPFAFLIANWRFMQVVREFKPTHIHAYAQLFVLNFLIGLFLFRAPMIYRAGDEPILHNWLWRSIWRFIVWRTWRFVANAQFVSRSLEAGGVSAERITVIYNVPPGRSSLERQPLNLDVPASARVIGFVGQISEHKGPHLLLEAFKALALGYPDVYLAVAGRISSWEGDAWARSLQNRIKADREIGTRVVFLGEIKNVPALLVRCELLVVPSLFEDPSPNVVMEAKQAGRPSVVFQRGGLPELIDHGTDGFICREATVPALTEALQAYLADPTMAPRHGVAARNSLERWSMPQFSLRWLEVYTSAINEVDGRTAMSAFSC